MLDPSQVIAKLLTKDKRYKFEAYVFVFEALNYAQNVLELGTDSLSEPSHGEGEEPEGPQRHVTGQQLCQAIRQYALQQYGYMAKTVLNSWGVHSTSDIGEIVFNLISIGHMRKTATDRREDFDDVFDFDAALKQQFRFHSLD